jgi:hypothetical protein
MAVFRIEKTKDYTAEEQSLITIYAEPTTAAIVTAMPDMDKAFAGIAASSAAKLAQMTDEDFKAVTFAPADEYEPDGAA